MKNRINERLEFISVTTLVVGIDIAKSVHWARFVDYRGREIGKAISFNCNRQGFESIVDKIKENCKNKLLQPELKHHFLLPRRIRLPYFNI